MLRANLLLLSLALVPFTAGADPAAWDDSHMRSSFAHRFDDVPPRPPIRGADRYHQAIEAPAETPRVGVAETTLEISPHEWQPGLGAGARAASPIERSGSGGFTTSGGAQASRSSGLHTGSSVGSRSRR
jgi:hypothetical protein